MRRAAVTTEIVASLIGTAALALPLAEIAADRAALVLLDRRSARLEMLQNTLDAARHGEALPLPSGWLVRVEPVGDGIERVTVTGPEVEAATLRRSRP